METVARPVETDAARRSRAGAAAEALGDEIRNIRESQAEILRTLQEILAAVRAPGRLSMPSVNALLPDTDARAFPAALPTRSHQKSVLLIDDDAEARQAALSALQQANVPARAASDGNQGLAAIARDKPDVVVLELDVAGAMAGKDVVNMIRATPEWLDIAIVLYTRAEVGGRREAQTVHGADELVQKAPGSAQVLVQRIIQLFQQR